MTSLLNDVLEVNRSDTGKIELRPELFDLDRFCQDILQEVQLAANPRCLLEFSFTGEEKHILTDPPLLCRILVSLLSNAIKYSPNGGNMRLGRPQ